MATSTTTLPTPAKHRSINSLQDIMSADETITGRPPRIPQHRLPGGRKPRHILAAMENIGNEEPAGRGRPRSDFDVCKDGIRDRRNGSSFAAAAAAAAAIDASPPSSKVYQYQNNSKMGRTKQIEALEEEYLNGRRRKVASPIAEETENENENEDESEGGEGADGGKDVEEEVTATIPRARKHSISSLLLAHAHPKPKHAPLPAPPLSLLHRKFSTLESSPAAHPAPVLPIFLPGTDPSLLQQMRAFRAHFESRAPLPHIQPRRQPPPRPPPEPRHQAPHQAPHQSPPYRPPQNPPLSPHQCPTNSSLASKYAFTLPHLPPLTHHSRTAIVTLTPTSRTSPGALTLQLRNLAERKGGGTHTYHIPIDGLPITITENATGATTVYAIEDLPLKHLTAVRYARHFVDVVKRGTIVGRVEVREKYGAGGVWIGRRWGDGRFEVQREGYDGGAKVEMSGQDGSRVKVWKGGKDVPVDRHRRLVERAKRMYIACVKALEEGEEENDDDGGQDEEEGGETTTTTTTTTSTTTTTPLLPRKRSENVASSTASSSEHRPNMDATFRVDSATTFVPSVGWCRRSRDHGWWSMLFLDGVRLEIDPASGDAVWIEKSGTKRVLEKGMEMRKVRERVRRFVEQGL